VRSRGRGRAGRDAGQREQWQQQKGELRGMKERSGRHRGRKGRDYESRNEVAAQGFEG